MYKLHYYPANANAAAHMLLEEIGAKHELVLVERATNSQKSPQYLKINPTGRIPALEDGSLTLFEAAAIVLHIADAHPEFRHGAESRNAGTGQVLPVADFPDEFASGRADDLSIP